MDNYYIEQKRSPIIKKTLRIIEKSRKINKDDYEKLLENIDSYIFAFKDDALLSKVLLLIINNQDINEALKRLTKMYRSLCIGNYTAKNKIVFENFLNIYFSICDSDKTKILDMFFNSVPILFNNKELVFDLLNYLLEDIMNLDIENMKNIIEDFITYMLQARTLYIDEYEFLERTKQLYDKLRDPENNNYVFRNNRIKEQLQEDELANGIYPIINSIVSENFRYASKLAKRTSTLSELVEKAEKVLKRCNKGD